MVEEDFPEAFKHLESALSISEEINDILSQFFANFWMGIGLSFCCEFEKAFFHFQKTLHINKEANNLWGISAIKSMLNFFVYYFRGEADLGFRTTNKAIQMAEESGDVYSKAFAYFSHGVSCYCKGFLDEAKKHLLKGGNFCDRINFFSFNALVQQYLGEIHFETGEYNISKEHYDKAVWLTKYNRFLPSLTKLNRIGLLRSKIADGEKDINLDELYNHLKENKIKFHDSLIARYVINCLLGINDLHISDAEDLIKKTVEVDRRRGMKFYLAKDYALYAKLLKQKGDRTKAKEKLAQSVEIYKTCGANGWLEKANEEMDSLS
jgi:tetratricopeptide (TPR) repeat protein